MCFFSSPFLKVIYNAISLQKIWLNSASYAHEVQQQNYFMHENKFAVEAVI